MMRLHIEMVETVINTSSATFTSKFHLCTVSKRYLLPVLYISKYIDIIFRRFFHLTGLFEKFYEICRIFDALSILFRKLIKTIPTKFHSLNIHLPMGIPGINLYRFCICKPISLTAEVLYCFTFTDMKFRMLYTSLPFKVKTRFIHESAPFYPFIVYIKYSAIFKKNALTDFFRKYIDCAYRTPSSGFTDVYPNSCQSIF